MGTPSGYIEAEFYDAWLQPENWPEVSDERLEALYNDLPRLFEVLEKSLTRGYPGGNKT